ncbi:MAG: UdgX family uracil-DNA binding protein [Sphingorhabdus sp.]
MIALQPPIDFDGWRNQAKALWAAQYPPEQVSWGQSSLFGNELNAAGDPMPEIRVPAAFVELAETVFMHSDPGKFDLLYRLFWRLQHDRRLLDDATDPDIVRAMLMVKAVRRDIHKMRAFVRFKEMQDEDGTAHYVAWFEPDHIIVRANAGFFVRRFASMRWSILTPILCIHWDGKTLSESPGIAKPADLNDDPVEDLWRSYYASIFNPARLKKKAMLKEMPRRYWKNMPETQLIPELIAGAQAREAAMVAIGKAPDEAAPESWAELEQAIDHCTRCPLYRDATQAVHGEGPRDARLMIIGEQPGDKEDLAGRPFVGPAGQVLDEALALAGIDRKTAYLTNAVRHFKHDWRGKVRLHRAPDTREIDTCRWWLDAERRLLQPQFILALGASAVRSLLGKTASVTKIRGEPIALPDGSTMIVTTHPSYILRVGDDHREQAMRDFIADLEIVADLLK